MSDYRLARQSLKEERKAVHDYTNRRSQSKGKGLKHAFTHALGEEKTHARMFRRYSDKSIDLARKERNK